MLALAALDPHQSWLNCESDQGQPCPAAPHSSNGHAPLCTQGLSLLKAPKGFRSSVPVTVGALRLLDDLGTVEIPTQGASLSPSSSWSPSVIPATAGEPEVRPGHEGYSRLGRQRATSDPLPVATQLLHGFYTCTICHTHNRCHIHTVTQSPFPIGRHLPPNSDTHIHTHCVCI